jgi:predicted outer membrane repeat protein
MDYLTRFSRFSNALPVGLNGAALYISNQAGVVNVVDGYFASNQASLGGAIFSQAYKLNIVGSHFILNKAYGVVS